MDVLRSAKEPFVEAQCLSSPAGNDSAIPGENAVRDARQPELAKPTEHLLRRPRRVERQRELTSAAVVAPANQRA
ncbi:MAG: hypothetical protein NVS4B3_11440 [Gemmatimonadaceae bacterium]